MPLNLQAEASDAPTVRVLIVEDEATEAGRIREMLSASDGPNFVVTHAERVEAALRSVREDPPDVVLLDLSLPEGEGLDALARAKVAMSTVPVVVMTDEEDDQVGLGSVRVGAQDYVVKQKCETQLLIRTLLNAVERHRMLSELRAAQQREHYLATHDTLTGLLNRSAFHDHLKRSFSLASRNRAQLAVLFIDLDRFKQINDTLGHTAGDELLEQFAARITEGRRSSDVVARLGGDEFVILLRDIRGDLAPATVAERLLGSLTRPYTLMGREYWVTGSIGIALYPQDGDDPEVLLRNADTAMYHAKAAGRNRYHHYTASMNAAAMERLDLETSLREAIDREQLTLHYQPQVDLEFGTIVGAEALVRWHDPQRGMIGPAEFIPLAEEMGIIGILGDWVLTRACDDALQWSEYSGEAIRVAVNVSAQQLEDEKFASRVIGVLEERGLNATQLELEITERVMMQPDGRAVQTLRELRAEGVRIAIDDFGTGYSSLRALRVEPVDVVKIDRSFVASVMEDAADATIVTAMVTMARGLGLEVVVEGIETRDQMSFLHGLGCNQMQGYLFWKPCAAEEFKRLLPSRER
jgi:diguanylate cyclase (GGDEF)-like protein